LLKGKKRKSVNTALVARGKRRRVTDVLRAEKKKRVEKKPEVA